MAAFPAAGILPKAETQADRFVEQGWDGKGVTVAIFDTGIDVGAEGLQQTADGRRKIVNVVDASGSGDVATTTRAPVEAMVITALSGRRLLLGPWAEGVAEVRLGLKPAFELFSEGLKRRYAEEAKKAETRAYRTALTALNGSIAAAKVAPAPAHETGGEPGGHVAELEARLAELEEAHAAYKATGPLVDCLLFEKDGRWRVVLAPTAEEEEDGQEVDLTDATVLTDYAEEQSFVRLCDRSMLNCAVHVYNSGDLLSIVTDAGSHGTHVAGIVAAHYPAQPELCGIAPNAQIVSVKIGDHRLGSMETSQAMLRGLAAVLDNKVDVINMSYGEPSKLPGQGKFVEMLAEVVYKHNLLFVTSAGNSGPALCTTGAPAGTESAAIGVGAFVSEEMQRAQYNLRHTVPDTQFTWSSRGPSVDGDLGVSISAPGGAIAPVPLWALRRNQHMNGTSMSSPNACGGFALILSALKAKGIAYSVPRVRRAVENTAKPVSGIEPLTIGHGLIQVCDALAYLEEHAESPLEDVRYRVKVQGHDGEEKRGIFLREHVEVQEASVHTVSVSPLLEGESGEANERRVAINVQLALSCPAEWVKCPTHLLLMHGGRQFAVEVDPTFALPNTLHYTEIEARDASRPSAGPLFRVPVTLIVPRAVNGPVPVSQSLAFQPGGVSRNFLSVPAYATWAEVRLRAVYLPAGPRVFYLHAVQRRPHMSYRDSQAKKAFRLREQGQRESFVFAVRPGLTLELCVAQFWSSLGESTLDLEVHFHGLLADRSSLSLSNARACAGLEVATFLRREELSPSCQLTTLVRQLQPTGAGAPVPLADRRNLLPEARRLHELVLEYSFEAKEAGMQATAVLPGIHGLLYENRVQGQLYMLFDAAKQLLATGDAYDETFKLPAKGAYTIRLQLASDSPAELQRLCNAPLELHLKLPSALPLQVFEQPQDYLSADATAAKSVPLAPGAHRRLYVALPSDVAKFPSLAQAGDTLVGTLTLKKTEGEGVTVISSSHWEVSVTCALPQLPQKAKGAAAAATEAAAKVDPCKGKGPLAALAHKRRQVFLEAYKGLPYKTEAERAAADELFAAAADSGVTAGTAEYIALLRARLGHCKAAGEAAAAAKRETLSALREACDEVELRAYFAQHHGKEAMTDDERLAHSHREQRRDALLEALLAAAELPSPEKATEEEKTAAAEAFAQLKTWTDTTAAKYAAAHVAHKRSRGLIGAALQAARKQVASTDAVKERPSYRASQEQLMRELGWPFHATHVRHQRLLASPPYGYTPF